MDDVLTAATPPVVAAAMRYAKRRLARGAGAWCGESPRELAAAAVCATALGDARWPRARISLARHLMDVIRHELARCAREEARMVRVDHLEADDPRCAAVDDATRHDPELATTMDRARSARRVLAWLYAQAPDDDELRRYVDAVLGGCHGPREIAAETGLSYAQACAVRKRARRLLERAPAALRADVALCLS